MLRKGFEVNKCYYENCMATLLRMPDNLIDLVVTSPPYDNLRNYERFSMNLKVIVPLLYKKVTDGGVVVWVGGDSTRNGSESGNSFRQALLFMSCGFNLHDTMIYAKNNYIPLTHNRYEQCWEYMFVFSKGKPKTFNPKMIDCLTGGITANWTHKGYCTTIKEGACRRRDENITTKQTKIAPNIFYYSLGALYAGHPAPFPDKLAEDHILSWSEPTDIVYDPFAGSGTTLKMAKKHHRLFIGSEIAVKYKPIIDKRLDF